MPLYLAIILAWANTYSHASATLCVSGTVQLLEVKYVEDWFCQIRSHLWSSMHSHLTGFITQLTEFKYSFALLRLVLLFRCECHVSTCSATSCSQNSRCTYQVYKMVEYNNLYFNLIILFQISVEKANIRIYRKAWITVKSYCIGTIEMCCNPKAEAHAAVHLQCCSL